MKVKPFTNVIQSLLDARTVIPPTTPAEEQTDSGTITSDTQYLAWKEEFEKDCCKIRNTALFLKRYSINGVFNKFAFHNEKSLVVAYKDQSCIKTLSSGKKERIQFISVWLQDPNIKACDDVGIYPPPLICPDGVFNMWQPSPYEAQPFTGEDDPEFDKDAVSLFVKHIEMLCNYDQTIVDWICSFVAHSIQVPAVKPEHAITLIGDEGTGKSKLVQTIGKLYGEGKVLETTSPERDVWGPFNSPMTTSFLVVLNETDKRNSKDAEGRKKGVITEYPLWINGKGKEQFLVNSYHRVLSTTNGADPNQTSEGDRRNVIVRCNDEIKGNVVYFTTLCEALQRPHALRSLYWSFKMMDISKWDFRIIPRTSYHQTIIECNKNPVEQFMESFTWNCIQQKKTSETLTGKAMLDLI
jgi:hypothetical protein